MYSVYVETYVHNMAIWGLEGRFKKYKGGGEQLVVAIEWMVISSSPLFTLEDL